MSAFYNGGTLKQSVTALLYGTPYHRLLNQIAGQLMKKYHLQKIDLFILVYLSDSANPNTSKDIVNLHMFTKGHISQSISRLHRTGYLTFSHDQKDRRCMHMTLTDKTWSLVDEIHQALDRIADITFQDITKEEIQSLESVASKIENNIRKALEKEKQ